MTYFYGTSGKDARTGGAADDTFELLGGNDTANGGGGSDTFYMGSGNDIANGGTGNDAIYDAGGNDVLRGGRGVDRMNGGSGNDRYVFDDGDTGVGPALRDTIVWMVAGDRIDLRPIDANTTQAGDQAFAYLGTSKLVADVPFTAAGQVRIIALDTQGNPITKPNTAIADWLVQGNTGGSLAPDFEILVDQWRMDDANSWLLL